MSVTRCVRQVGIGDGEEMCSKLGSKSNWISSASVRERWSNYHQRREFVARSRQRQSSLIREFSVVQYSIFNKVVDSGGIKRSSGEVWFNICL